MLCGCLWGMYISNYHEVDKDEFCLLGNIGELV